MDAFFASSKRLMETPLSTEKIAQLGDDDLDDRVWMRLSSLIDYFDPAALRAADPDVASYLATRVFEWEVGNGGLHQYFFNFNGPDHLAAVLSGYTRLGLHGPRRTVEEIVEPIAAREAAWRESLRDGTIETFFTSYVESQLPDVDDRIDMHDAERISLVRAPPAKIAR